MMIRMNVGCYKGDIRGPFHSETAKMLIARGDASPTESIGDGEYRVIETEIETESAAAIEIETESAAAVEAPAVGSVPADEQALNSKKKARR